MIFTIFLDIFKILKCTGNGFNYTLVVLTILMNKKNTYIVSNTLTNEILKPVKNKSEISDVFLFFLNGFDKLLVLTYKTLEPAPLNKLEIRHFLFDFSSVKRLRR